MSIVKFIPLFVFSTFLIACGNEQAPMQNETSEKVSSDLFELQKKALDDAKNIEKVLSDEDHKRKDKLKELGL
jgi:hypothetical protein